MVGGELCVCVCRFIVDLGITALLNELPKLVCNEEVAAENERKSGICIAKCSVICS